MDAGRTAGQLLGEHGTTYAEELGIAVERDTPGPLFELLVASILMSARIGSRIAVDAARTILRDRGWSTAEDLAATSWEQRVDALNEANYTRYQESTATMLGDTAELLRDRYGGDLRRLRDEAERDPARMRELLEEFKGLGDVGVDIFFREVQAEWGELYPFADDRVRGAAGDLGLPTSADGLADLVPRADYPRLVAALTRVAIGDVDDDDRTSLLRRSKDDLYELAQERDVPGRSDMTKEELVDALAGS